MEVDSTICTEQVLISSTQLRIAHSPALGMEVLMIQLICPLLIINRGDALVFICLCCCEAIELFMTGLIEVIAQPEITCQLFIRILPSSLTNNDK